MVTVSEEIKKMYRASSFPKELYIEFPEITLNNSNIFTFELSENLCSDKELHFGACEAGQFKARVEGLGREYIGKQCNIYQIIGGNRVNLGTYKVKNVSKKDNLGYRTITGYDDIHWKLDKDVTDWYVSLALPLTLKTFRQSLFAYVGISIADQTLVNDDITVKRVELSNTLTGREVAEAIGEVNGAFGHIGRNGLFKYITLGSTGLYPSDDLYPSNDLYPSEADTIFESAGNFSCVREDYATVAIDCLIIREEDGGIAKKVYDKKKYVNPYLLTDNFLVFGKSDSELETIGRNLFEVIKQSAYTPFDANVVGLPYMEVGDGIAFTLKKDNFYSYIMKRTLKGIQSLMDSYSASGNQYRDNDISELAKIGMTKGSVNKVSKELETFKKETTSRFDVTNNSIKAEVKRATDAENYLAGQITLTADKLKTSLEDTEKGLRSSIEETAEAITSMVEDTEGKFSELEQTINGWTFTTASGETKISGDMIETGILKGVTILFTEQNALFWACGTDEIEGAQSSAEWCCDSNALYCHLRGTRTIELWRKTGNGYFNGTLDVEMVVNAGEIFIKDSWWDGWSVTEVCENLWDRVTDIEDRLDAIGA